MAFPVDHSPPPRPLTPLKATGDPRRDLDLARRVLDGEPAAQREFVDRMRIVGRVLAARNGRMGRPLAPNDLEDLTQDVLVIVWKNLASYAGAAPLEAWVFRICVYELLNAVRRQGKRARTRLLDDEAARLLPDAAAEPEPPDARGLRSFLKHLAPREEEVIGLRHVEGLTFQETSAVLGVSVSSVKTHYYRALDKLRDVLRLRAGEPR